MPRLFLREAAQLKTEGTGPGGALWEAARDTTRIHLPACLSSQTTKGPDRPNKAHYIAFMLNTRVNLPFSRVEKIACSI
jgi:hypothetical protein